MRRKSARIFFFLLASVGIFSNLNSTWNETFIHTRHIFRLDEAKEEVLKRRSNLVANLVVFTLLQVKKKKKVSKIILRIIITDFYVEVIVTKNVSGIFGRVKALSVLPTLLHISYAIHYGSLVLRYLETFSLS